MDPSNSNVIYAGTGEGYFNEDSVRGAGIFKSTDAGANWSYLTNTNTSDFTTLTTSWSVQTTINESMPARELACGGAQTVGQPDAGAQPRTDWRLSGFDH
jgi:hypothetical protein